MNIYILFIVFSIYSYKTTLISRCIFTESSSEQKGGAIYLLYQDSVNEITGQTLIVNSAFILCLSDFGGCIYFLDLSDAKSDEKTSNNCTLYKSNSISHGSYIKTLC